MNRAIDLSFRNAERENTVRTPRPRESGQSSGETQAPRRVGDETSRCASPSGNERDQAHYSLLHAGETAAPFGGRQSMEESNSKGSTTRRNNLKGTARALRGMASIRSSAIRCRQKMGIRTAPETCGDHGPGDHEADHTEDLRRSETRENETMTQSLRGASGREI